MRTTLRTALAAALASLLAAALPAAAHHSFPAQYDAEKPVTLTGTVTRVEWTNPHIFIYIDVPDEESGEVVKANALAPVSKKMSPLRCPFSAAGR